MVYVIIALLVALSVVIKKGIIDYYKAVIGK